MAFFMLLCIYLSLIGVLFCACYLEPTLHFNSKDILKYTFEFYCHTKTIFRNLECEQMTKFHLEECGFLRQK